MKRYVVDVVIDKEYNNMPVPVIVAASSHDEIEKTLDRVYPGSTLVIVRGEYDEVFK